MFEYIIALYLRLSIDDKKVESMSIDSQRELLRNYISNMGIDNVKIVEYIDNGYSGTNFERPAVQQLLEDIRTLKVNCIIVKDFSRFGRNSIEVGYFTQQVFPLYNVRFISVNDYYDSDDHKGDTGGLEVTIKYLVNEYYSKDLSVKSKTALQAKMKRGEFKSKCYCYGYKADENRNMVIDTEVADNIKLIYELASIGKNSAEIIKELFVRKIPTPAQYKAQQGKKYNVQDCKYWDRTQISRILTDEQYTGTYVKGKRTTREVGSGRMLLKDESEWVKIPNHHPAIISKELYDKVQATRRTINTTKRNVHIYPLKSKVFCGCCNHALHYAAKKRPVFRCSYTTHDETEPCYRMSIFEDELNEAVFATLNKQIEILTNIDNFDSMDKLNLQTSYTIELSQQIEHLQNEKQTLYERMLMQEISTEEYKQLKEACERKIRDYKAQLDRSEKNIEYSKQSLNSQQQLLKYSQTIKKETTLTQQLADAFVEKVIVYPNKEIEIVWSVKEFYGKLATA